MGSRVWLSVRARVQVTLMQRRGGQLRRQRRAGIVLASGGQGVELPASHDMGVAGVPVGVAAVSRVR
jgi:hypothetical protein